MGINPQRDCASTSAGSQKGINMFEISCEERLVLLALDKYGAVMTETCLGLVTGLPAEKIQKSVASLAKMGRARRILLRDETYYVSISLSSQPVFPNWNEWLGTFCAVFPQFVEGDTLGTMYASCGVVLLAALAGGTRDVGSISHTTKLPVGFAMHVLGMAEREGVLSLDSAFNLKQTIRQRNHDFGEVEQRLHDLKEDLWEFCWTPEIEAELCTLREGRQFGGAVDRWVDQ
jgi:hypothetical protein